MQFLIKCFGSNKMYIESNGDTWLILKEKSVFVSRQGKQDVSIYKQSCWGRRQIDGLLYKCCVRFACEDGSVVRDYEAIPSFINMEFLKDKGFMN